MTPFCTLIVCASLAADPVAADLVIRNGTIHDGSTNPPTRGDVAIKGDKIVAVGSFTALPGAEVFDAAGLIICPGFIDLHNHSDSPILAEKTRAAANYLRQGCTTLVTGNCGFGHVDVADYFKKLEEQLPGVNIIHLMPHGSVRKQVMGEDDRPPTPAELDKMRALVDQGMTDGAWGMSTGLIYTPGAYAKTDEIVELAKVVAKHGGFYASHMRNENTKVIEAIDEALTIGRQAKLPVHISHFKCSGPSSWGFSDAMVQKVKQAQAAGLTVTADQYPYTASSTGLEPTLVPTWAREGGHPKLLARLDDPAKGRELLDEIARELAKRGGGQRIVIAKASKTTDSSKIVGKNLLQASDAAGKPLIDFINQLLHDGDVSIINFGMTDKDMRCIMSESFVATASDGSAKVPDDDKPHPRSYGTFPAKIGRYAFRQKWITVDHAIRSSTGLPADILHLPHRGYLKPGYSADIVILKLEDFIDHATYNDPHQYSVGVKRVYINGQLAVKDDEFTGTVAGRPLRHHK